MGRMGYKPIPVPPSVKVRNTGGIVEVEGPKGKLSLTLPRGIVLAEEGKVIRVLNQGEGKKGKMLHGLARSLLNNMILGVSQGFEKVLLIEGVGYRANLKGKVLELSLGYSHPIQYEVPEDVKIEVKDQTTIIVRGVDKQRVGEVAAQIRRFRPPDPYKAKGIRYQDEVVRRKAGKQRA